MSFKNNAAWRKHQISKKIMVSTILLVQQSDSIQYLFIYKQIVYMHFNLKVGNIVVAERLIALYPLTAIINSGKSHTTVCQYKY